MTQFASAMSSSDNERIIRIFVSSTFRDMMRERDLLVKEVFPELRRKCAKRFVTFIEVDLRWGITKEQAEEGKILPLCLAEIERCRPYFIALLGERYGALPDTIHPEILEREPWLLEHVQNGTSVTELEVLHGVLNNPRMQHHAFFYFRDPAYVSSPTLSDEERSELLEQNNPAEIEKYGEVEAAHRTEQRMKKLGRATGRRIIQITSSSSTTSALRPTAHRWTALSVDCCLNSKLASKLLTTSQPNPTRCAKRFPSGSRKHQEWAALFSCLTGSIRCKAANPTNACYFYRVTSHRMSL